MSRRSVIGEGLYAVRGRGASLKVFADAGHGGSSSACAEEYAGWVLGFLERSLAQGT